MLFYGALHSFTDSTFKDRSFKDRYFTDRLHGGVSSSLAVYVPLIGYLGGWLLRIFAFPGSVGGLAEGQG